MKGLIALGVAAALPLVAAPKCDPTPEDPWREPGFGRPAVVQVWEWDDDPGNLVPPQRLDLQMDTSDQTTGGGPIERCLHYGGEPKVGPGTEVWCIGVDY